MQASHPQNASAAKFGVYSPRLREPRAREIAEHVLSAPWTCDMDNIGAAEIGRIESTRSSLKGIRTSLLIANFQPVGLHRGHVLEAWLEEPGEGVDALGEELMDLRDELREDIGQGVNESLRTQLQALREEHES